MKLHPLIATLALSWLANVASAQTFTTLKSFGILTNVSGFYPNSSLVQGADGMLYGTTSYGEGNVQGTVFKVQPDGSGFSVLKQFTNELEGVQPYAGLALAGDTLYGTTTSGGSVNAGTVFKVKTNGTEFAVLKEFNGIDGGNPGVAMTLSGGVLYGTTSSGGGAANGTVFKLNTDGTGFTVVKEFAGRDGANPYGVTIAGNLIYGATQAGGNTDYGTIYKMNTDGTGHSVLKHFAASDGISPTALTLAGGVLYGTAFVGGSADNGTLFKINTDGTGFAVLTEFIDANSEGARPGPVIFAGNVLYGATFQGGNSGNGVVFKLNADGSDFSVLEHFAGNAGYGAFGLILSGSTLFGALQLGGIQNNGTLFRLNTDGSGYSVFKEFTYEPDGDGPSSIAASSNVLYGTTSGGGSHRFGTVFRLNADGAGYVVLKHFSAAANNPGSSVFTNEDGFAPRAGLTVSGGVLYGAASAGGAAGSGTLYKLNSDGTGFTVLKTFSAFTTTFSGARTNSDGIYPGATMLLAGNVLFGTTTDGGIYGAGAVFRIETNGANFTVIKHFSWSDGVLPSGSLVSADGVLYGATAGTFGSVFKLNLDGTGFTVLKSFPMTYYEPAVGAFINADGASAQGVTLSGGVLYGSTSAGGNFGRGTMFKMNLDGSDFTVLKHFNGEGDTPLSSPVVSGNKLFGTTVYGGSVASLGTVVRMNTDGTGFIVMKRFGVGPIEDGWYPGQIVLSGGALYGTAIEGGLLNRGTVFKIDLSIPLNVQSLDDRVVLNWSDASFALQAAPMVTGAYTNVPGAVSPYTNMVSGPQTFFRLIGN